ncbi:MAG: alpha/beta hydrolase-fold protein [Hespellia sp.]|nr:alpha/beta hydrolase-fold protein [Hespellia sp.]
MTHITCSFPSYALGTMAEFHVILPRKYNINLKEESFHAIPDEGYRTLILLHGACDSASDWLLHSRVADYADELNIALIIPSTGNSFYLDDVNSVNSFTFITEELLNYARDIFPLSMKREDTFIFGYSMGGYGAVRAGILRPDLFGKVGSMSGALDIKLAARYIRTCGCLLPKELSDIKSLDGTDRDLFHCLEEADTCGNTYPAFYLTCGNQDVFAKSATQFHDALIQKGFRSTCSITEGTHEWNYWCHALTKVIAWMYQPEK